MSQTQHTQGPWIYEYSPYTSQDGDEIPAFEIFGSEKVCDTNEDRPEHEQEANARLIAAAPDLLGALEEFVADMAGRFGQIPDDCTAYQQALAAIAKATGG